MGKKNVANYRSGFFGAKMNGNPRFVKHRQLRSSGKSTQKKKKFIVVMKLRGPL